MHTYVLAASLTRVWVQVSSRNVIAEVVGGADPEGIVLLGGHVDSWDVGTGAVDDGAGFFCGIASTLPSPPRSSAPAHGRVLCVSTAICAYVRVWTAWEAVRLINDLIKDGSIRRPRRTIRFIAWADEEVSPDPPPSPFFVLQDGELTL
jgi:hypothetical protein